MDSVAEAVAQFRRELLTGHYAGANFVVASAAEGALFEAAGTNCARRA